MWAGGDYEKVAIRIAAIAERLVDTVDHRRSLRDAAMVDLACGTGSVALAAAARGAKVIAIDATPELLAIGAEKAAAAALPIDFRRADAAETGLEAASVDVVVSSMGLIFVEPDKQVRELGRVLKPGGVLGFSAWRRVASNPFFDPIAAVLGPPASSAYSPDQWGDDDLVMSRLSSTFDGIRISHELHTWTFESVDAALRFVTSESPMHVATMNAAGSKRDALTVAFETALAAHAGTGGQVAFDSPYSIVTATRR